MSSLGVPVLAILLAWVILGEVPDTLTKLGVVLVVTGLVVINLPGRKKA
jgi:drug/metabolite transporter (DMT)-like permease